ncbi:7TM diverse intracellular signaling domain-containing protein [Mangrovivirga cuniculi]|uniref:7TM diverse intracellular signaling domain-containing protein n=1 Tax=Mangrovivirga cuniculi TaxID=2715131 RepID=UPI0010BED5D9|nr:7TM diverse intracellular signaling domain-containing protein [Mangrovivirga cuniculi]
MKRAFFYISIILFIFKGTASAASIDTIYLSDLNKKLIVADDIHVFQSTRDIDLNKIDYRNQKWKNIDSIFQSKPTELYTYILISINNDTDLDKEVFFDLDDPSIYDVYGILIDHNTGEKIDYRSGLAAGKLKNTNNTDNAFKFQLSEGHQYTFIAKLTLKNFTSLSSELYSVEGYSNETSIHFLIFGIYYGLITAIIIYALFFYISSGFRWFLYFAIATFFFSIVTGAYDGFTGFLLPWFVKLFNGYHDLVSGGLSNIFTLLFAASFLGIKSFKNNFFKVFAFLIAANLLSFIFYFFIPDVGFYIVISNAIIGAPLITATSIYYYKKGDKSLIYLVLAYLIFSIFIFISALYLFRAIPANKFTYYSLHIGYTIHLLFLSVVLIERIRSIRKEVDQQKILNAINERKMFERFNQDLEDTVNTRTQDLAIKEVNLRTILENNDIGIWLTNTQLRVIECNHKAKEFIYHLNKYVNFGIDTNLNEVLHDIPVMNSWFKRYENALNGQEITFEYSYNIKGETRYLEVQLFPILASGNVSGVATFLNDITDHKIKENTLEKTNNELSRVNSELDKFVYGASHDLKAPLGSLKGLIYLLKHETDQSAIDEYFSRMEGSIDRMESFIKDLVNYSRNSRAELVIEEVEPEKIVNEIIENLRYNEDYKNVTLDTRFNLNDGTIYSDINRIKVILSNIIGNALKYHDPEKVNPHVKICVSMIDNKLKVVVEDNGLGIDEEHKNKIFDMFYRAHDSSEGTGLGLFIVKETVEKLDGELSLNTKAGEGSKFTILLPNLR